MELQAQNILSYFIANSDNKHDYTFETKYKQIIIYYKNTEIYYYNFINKESINKITEISKRLINYNRYSMYPRLITKNKRIYLFFKQINLNNEIKKLYKFRIKNKNMQKYRYEYYKSCFEISHYNLYYYKYKIYIRNTLYDKDRPYLSLIITSFL
jgi:hypothetical protein